MKQAPKKKVLFLITKATWGGAQKYVYDLATHLPKDKFEPIVAFGESDDCNNYLMKRKSKPATFPLSDAISRSCQISPVSFRFSSVCGVCDPMSCISIVPRRRRLGRSRHGSQEFLKEFSPYMAGRLRKIEMYLRAKLYIS